MSHFPPFTSKAIRLPLKDVDTDMIIPARFLTTTTKEGLGQHLFANLRKEDPELPFNRQELRDAHILIVGRNFGCGSSREHAPWALLDWGIKVIISSEFADIFKGNSEKNELLPIVLPEETVQKFLKNNDDDAEYHVDLEKQLVVDPYGQNHPFEISGFSKIRFLEGLSDLDYLVKFSDEIREFEKKRIQYIPHT